MAKCLIEMCSTVEWKTELIKDAPEEIAMQSVEGVAWFLLAVYSKMQRKDKSRMELLGKTNENST